MAIERRNSDVVHSFNSVRVFRHKPKRRQHSFALQTHHASYSIDARTRKSSPVSRNMITEQRTYGTKYIRKIYESERGTIPAMFSSSVWSAAEEYL